MNLIVSVEIYPMYFSKGVYSFMINWLEIEYVTPMAILLHGIIQAYRKTQTLDLRHI